MKNIIRRKVEGDFNDAVAAARLKQYGIWSEVRAGARYKIMQRCGGCCEICDFPCKPILHMHHLLPKAHGGEGMVLNIVALCPNCHAIVHKIRSDYRFRILNDWPAWQDGTYTDDQKELFKAIASNRLLIEWSGDWIIFEPTEKYLKWVQALIDRKAKK